MDLRVDPGTPVLGGRIPPARRQGGVVPALHRGCQGAAVFRKHWGLPVQPRCGSSARPTPGPAGTIRKWEQSVTATTAEVGLSAEQVDHVLEAFAERFLVRRLPSEQPGPGEEGTPSRRYELMHEHLVQLLEESPPEGAPALRNAEARLRSRRERTRNRFRTPKRHRSPTGIFVSVRSERGSRHSSPSRSPSAGYTPIVALHPRSGGSPDAALVEPPARHACNVC